MKRLILLHIVLSTFLLTLHAQTPAQADQLFTEQKYTEAKEVYAQLLKRDVRNTLYLYRYARCAYELGHQQEAIDYFVKAGTKYALRDFYLGELYQQTYQFDEAQIVYQRYLSTLDTTQERYAYVVKQIEAAEKAARYLRRVTDLAIVDSIILPKDSFLQAYKLTVEAGTLAADSTGLITYTNQRDDRRILAQQLGTHTALLSTQRLLDGWEECDTLNLDVVGNSNYPFVLSDGLTLYFASDDKAGLGGYDIYLTRYNVEQDTYLAPENLGFPFNSPANDYMLAIDEVNHLGYFATDRFTADSLVAIYTFVPNNETRVLRDVDSTYLRAAAQLKAYRVATEPIQPQEAETWSEILELPTANIATFESVLFVVNDSIVCYTDDDFKSVDAKDLLQDYLDTEQEVSQIKNALYSARLQYAAQEPTERLTLAQTILQYETELPQLENECEQLAAQIRILELRARE